MIRPELLAPAGDMEKLKTAFYFGADAAYAGGKDLSLRAGAGGFTDGEFKEAVRFSHALGKKLYAAVNIFCKNADLKPAEEYIKFLAETGVDGVIVSDPGILCAARRIAPELPVSLSTQANVLNVAAAKFWHAAGVSRVILARELSLKEIAEIHAAVPEVELETFVHGAMCISYSGRCLLSDYRAGRPSNRGECVQACRWNYELREKGSGGAYMDIEEDGRGTYILNSKDLCLINYLPQLAAAGVASFKIEGRMKSEYYLATVVNAYRRALDAYYEKGEEYLNDPVFMAELEKTAHREFTTAFLLGENDRTENFADSQSRGTHVFVAKVLSYDGAKGFAAVEMRNRFRTGDELEVLSPSDSFNKIIRVGKMEDESGNAIEDVKKVQQKVYIRTEVPLAAGDILRRKA